MSLVAARKNLANDRSATASEQPVALGQEHETSSEATSLTHSRAAIRNPTENASTEDSQPSRTVQSAGLGTPLDATEQQRAKKKRKNKRRNKGKRPAVPPVESSNPTEDTTHQSSSVQSTGAQTSNVQQTEPQPPIFDASLLALHSGSGKSRGRSAAKSGQSSSLSVAASKDDAAVHDDHIPPASSSSMGQYDHLIGDPNLDLSERKNKGRVDSVSPRETTVEELSDEEPTFEAYVPSPEHKVGSSSRQAASTASSEVNPPSGSFAPSPRSPERSSREELTASAETDDEAERPKRAPMAIRGAGTSGPEDPRQPGQKTAGIARSSQSSRSGQLSRRALTSGRLSPIQEISSPLAVRGGLATPGSSTTAQTGSTGRRQPVTPDSTAEPSDASSVSVHRDSGARPADSHSHPGGQLSQESVRQPVSRGVVECAKAECKNRCDLWDGVRVFCPKCGPYSEVRYCTQEHLLDDAKWHWVWCGRMTITHPCRELIAQQVRERMPLMPSLHNWDSPERHRQALYFDRAAQAGDYFVFADWADLRDAGFPRDSLPLRCSPRIVETIRFDGPEEKDRFRRILAVCLFCKYSLLSSILHQQRKLTALTATVENANLVDFMFRMIRDALRSRSGWTLDMDSAVRFQFVREFGVSIALQIAGERHACECDWDGSSPRRCHDPVCVSERFYLLGDMSKGRGYRGLVVRMEDEYWLVRAARTTHPHVTSVEARTRGEGFPGVPDEERRQFCRGPGWDGAGAGALEIEGVNC